MCAFYSNQSVVPAQTSTGICSGIINRSESYNGELNYITDIWVFLIDSLPEFEFLACNNKNNGQWAIYSWMICKVRKKNCNWKDKENFELKKINNWGLEQNNCDYVFCYNGAALQYIVTTNITRDTGGKGKVMVVFGMTKTTSWQLSHICVFVGFFCVCVSWSLWCYQGKYITHTPNLPFHSFLLHTLSLSF